MAVIRRYGIVGDYAVEIGFSLQPDGSVSNIHLVQASGDKRLDATVMRIPANAAPFPPFTADMARTPRRLMLPLRFRLPPPAPDPQKR